MSDQSNVVVSVPVMAVTYIIEDDAPPNIEDLFGFVAKPDEPIQNPTTPT